MASLYVPGKHKGKYSTSKENHLKNLKGFPCHNYMVYLVTHHLVFEANLTAIWED